jgi:putative transposase
MTAAAVHEAVEAAVAELAPLVGVRAACRAVGRSQAEHYRRHRKSPPPPPKPAPPRRAQPRALSPGQREQVRAVLNSEEFVDAAPATVYHTLLDDGIYLASPSTMYRVLREHGEVRERRRHATHPAHVKPELWATAPNQVWSWDITRLRGPGRRDFYHLYCIIDIYSRYTVGWLVAARESEYLAEQLIADTLAKQNVTADQLTIHADRGSSMASRTVAQLLADLGVARSHSRPRTCDDNPFSESQFKTLKYRPDFPDRFTSIEHARAYCREFFRWYNHDHYHSGVGWHHPTDVHHGLTDGVDKARADVLSAAYRRHPDRFVRRPPTPPAIPTTVWINQPPTDEHNNSNSTTLATPPAPDTARVISSVGQSPTEPHVLDRRQGVATRPSEARPAPCHQARLRGTPAGPDHADHHDLRGRAGVPGQRPEHHTPTPDSLNEYRTQPPHKA